MGGMPAGSDFPAGQSVAMVPGAKCNPGHVNQDINTWQSEIRDNTVVGNGTWLRAGETWDGHCGFGIVSGPYTHRSHYSTLSAKWYSAIHALTSDC